MMNIIKHHSHKLLRGVLAAGCLFAGSILPASAADNVAGNSLQSVDFAELPGNKAQITLTLSKPAPAPLSFTIDNPARIALDFADTSNNLDKRSQNIGIGMAESITAVEAQGRTRAQEPVPRWFPDPGSPVAVVHPWATLSFCWYRMPVESYPKPQPWHHVRLAVVTTP